MNPYDPCMANRDIEEKQHTVTWHVDNLKLGHVNKRVNDNFLVWLNKTYASNKIGEVKAVQGTKHDYIAMVLDFSEPGVLKINTTDFVKGMVQDFLGELRGKAKYQIWQVDGPGECYTIKSCPSSCNCCQCCIILI